MELALAYNPDITPKRAWQKLQSWIDYNKPLTKALQKAGYNPRRRSFTPMEVKLIFDFLGEP
jgi:hypothetical protein